MGFNSWTSHLLLASQLERKFDNSSPLALGGRQTVFLNNESVMSLAHKYEVPKKRLEILQTYSDIDSETLRSKGGITDTLFAQSLLDMEIISFDATTYENASRVLDLNVSFSKQDATSLLGQMEAVYDGGSLDNVFGPAMAIKNLSSLLRSGGRIFNWVCASNWPGAYSMISPEWLLSFYALNQFKKIRIYVFIPQIDDSAWPNLKAAVYRYSPYFTRSATWDPWKAIQSHPGHPCFVLGVAECGISKQPDDWKVPMQSHYLTEDLVDWRMDYDEFDDLPFVFGSTSGGESDQQPYASDHFEFKGMIEGLPKQF